MSYRDTTPETSGNAPKRHERTARLMQILDWPVIFGALVTIPLLVLDQTHHSGPWHTVARVGDWVVWIIFVVDFVAMLAVVEDRRAYVRSHPLDLVVIILTPPFLPVGIQWVRVLRVLRVVRLLRLPRALNRKLSLESIEYGGLLATMALVGGAAAFSAAEKIPYGDAVYWALGTMTTAGYGDIRPTTTLAKIVSCVLMVVGTGFFALVTGAVAQRFLSSEAASIEEAAHDTKAAALAADADEHLILEEIRSLSAQVKALKEALASRPDDGLAS